MWSYLRHPSIDEQFGARHVAALVRREERYRVRDLVGAPEPAEGDRPRVVLVQALRVEVAQPAQAGRVDCPWAHHVHADLARLQVGRERARARSAALVALYTDTPGNPFEPTTDDVKIIDAPSGRIGSAFCTANSAPFTLMSKCLSKNSSVITVSGAASAMPAFPNSTSIRRSSSF